MEAKPGQPIYITVGEGVYKLTAFRVLSMHSNGMPGMIELIPDSAVGPFVPGAIYTFGYMLTQKPLHEPSTN